MNTLLIVIHVVSCFVLILVVLLQAGRGADMGAAFGGASTPMFGSGSSVNPLARITTFTAVTFLATALILAVSSARRASVFDSMSEPLAAPPRAESTATGVPAESPQAQATPPSAQPLTIPAAPNAPAASDENAPAAGNEAAPAAPSAAPAGAPAGAAPAQGAPGGAAPAAAPAQGSPAEQPAH